MSDPAQAPVVTELVVTSDSAGAVDYARAMQAAQLAAAAAMVANDNLANSMRSANDNARDASEQNGRVTIGLRQLAQGALDVAEAWAKKVAVGIAVVGVVSTLFRVLMPIYVAYKLVKTGIDLVTEAWKLSGDQLAEYIGIADKASKLDLSTTFFQRISKSAADAKVPVDDLTAAFKKLQEATAPQLGGSAGMNRLTELTDAGNFKGNTGVGQLASANTTEEKFRAVVSLIDQAMEKGERLAALDVSKTFLGDAATAALAKDSDYLNKMLASADAISAEKLVSDEDVGNALALQQRIDAAEKILSQRWHPIQDILVGLGLKMREGWVNILEAIAASFDWLGKFIDRLSSMPSSLVDKFVNLTTTPESRAANAAYYGVVTDKNDPQWQMDIARQKLAAGLNNPANVLRARDETNAVQNSVFRDTSKKTGDDEIASAYGRAEESLLKYIEVTKAAAISTGQGVEQQERLKAIAQLTAAGIKDGLTPAAAKAKAEMSGLGEQAGAAALALAKAKVAADIKFNRDTAFLSQEDVSIAQQLKGIYPDVATALGSVEAQGIRTNNAFREISSTIETNLTSGLTDIAMGQKSIAQGASDMGLAFVKAIEQMIIKIYVVEPLLRNLQVLMNSVGGLGSLGLGVVGGGSFSGQDAALNRSLFPGYGTAIGANADGTDNWRGGLTSVNERGGEILDLPGGTRIIPHDVSMKMAANSNAAPVVNVIIEGASSQPSVSQSQNASGGTDIRVTFRDAVRGVMTEDAANNGPISAAMAQRFRGSKFGGS